MKHSPRISVLLPVFNAAAHVAESIDSVLSQTFDDFEILAIDDGSSDGSLEILKSRRDGRVRVISRENRGLIATLNEGIQLARGEFVARMDADDVCMPERLARQLAYLEKHPEVAVVGSWIERIGAGRGVVEYPGEWQNVACGMIFRCPLAHPTVMMRRSLFAIEGLAYDPAARHTEDYALWMRMSAEHRLANLPEVLLRYRTHAGQVSAVYAAEQELRVVQLQAGLIRERLDLVVTEKQAELHGKLAFSRLEASAAFVAATDEWLLTLAAANEKRSAFPKEPFLRTLVGRYVSVHRFAREQGMAPPAVAGSPFARFIHPGAL